MREYNIAPMVILALETITRSGSIGLWDDGALHAREGDAVRTHAERLPAEIVSWLERHGRTLADVDLFAVVSGPGSFTGIRVGMAAIQGLALAGHRRAVGIPSLDAVATAYLLREPSFATPPLGIDQPQADAASVLLMPCVDAQRDQVFFAGFEVVPSALRDASEPQREKRLKDCRVVVAPAVGTPMDMAELAAGAAGNRRVVFVGDGAVRYADLLQAALPGASILRAPVPLAGAAAVIASERQSEGGAPHALRPIYIRRPDVELARERRRAAAGPAEPDYSISRASFDDIPAVERLQGQTFTNPWGSAAIRWELENTDVARLYVMRTKAGDLLGYCACWIVFDELHINSLAIDPGRRRQGLARRLLEHVMAEARSGGVNAATLEVRSSNEGARKLYEGLKFSVEGVRRDYYQHPREDALILWRRGLA